MVKNVLQIRKGNHSKTKQRKIFSYKYLSIIDVIKQHHHNLCDSNIALKDLGLSVMHNDNSFCVFNIHKKF